MIDFIDFIPQMIKKGGLFKSDEFESMDTIIGRLNYWKEEYPQHKILNIETVVLPNIHSSREEGSEDTDLLTTGEMQTKWHQFIRVWFEENGNS